MRFTVSLAILFLAFGCNSGSVSPSSYATTPFDPDRNTVMARKLNAEGASALEAGDLELAETKLRASLSADLLFGPAHNNLGIVYMRQGKYYLAAWEFQHALKSMPGSVEPRNNLGMVLEMVGRYEQAEQYFEEALATRPDDVNVLCNFARARVRHNINDARTKILLEDIVMKSDSNDWRHWARMQLIRLAAGADVETATESSSVNQ